jgi:hypothetical protein
LSAVTVRGMNETCLHYTPELQGPRCAGVRYNHPAGRMRVLMYFNWMPAVAGWRGREFNRG